MTKIMLRPRRPRSYTSSPTTTLSSSLKCDTCHETSTITMWNFDYKNNNNKCPDAMNIISDESMSSYSDSDDDDMLSVHHSYHNSSNNNNSNCFTPISTSRPNYNHSSIKTSFPSTIESIHYSPNSYMNTDDSSKDVLPLCRISHSREKQLAQRALMVRTCMALFAVLAVAISLISSSKQPKQFKRPEMIQREVHPSSPQEQPIQQQVSDEIQIRKRRLTQIAISKKVHTSMATTPSLRTTPTTTTRVLSIAQEAKIRRDAMKRLVDQYGVGPHLVEFQLKMWKEIVDDITTGKTTTVSIQPFTSYFTVEMAPVHMMPSTVHVFLQQVSYGLWNDTSFYLNTDHLFAAHPVSGNGQVSKRSAFAQSSFGSLQYTEYNSAYPHLPYTLGFVGHGPEFYINKESNMHHDPCFANVVIGRTTVDTLFRMKGNDRTPARIRPVEIVSARIIQRNHLHPQAMAEYVQTTLQL